VPLPPRLQQLLDTFAMFPDPADRTTLLLSYADKFRPVPPEIAVRPFSKAHQVPACESEAYAWAVKNADGTLEAALRGGEPVGRVGQGARAILDTTLSGSAAGSRRADLTGDRRADLPAEHLDGKRDRPDVDGQRREGAGRARRDGGYQVMLECLLTTERVRQNSRFWVWRTGRGWGRRVGVPGKRLPTTAPHVSSATGERQRQLPTAASVPENDAGGEPGTRDALPALRRTP
jgi:sulfur transfer protein SufE